MEKTNVIFRLSKQDKDLLKEKAANAGVSVARFIKMLVFSENTPTLAKN